MSFNRSFSPARNPFQQCSLRSIQFQSQVQRSISTTSSSSSSLLCTSCPLPISRISVRTTIKSSDLDLNRRSASTNSSLNFHSNKQATLLTRRRLQAVRGVPSNSFSFSSSSRSTSTSNSNSTSSSPASHARTNSSSAKNAQERFAKAQSDAYKTRNRSLFMYTAAVFIAGLGVTYAAVPLYRAFCSATGFSGTPIIGETGIGRFAPSRLQATSSISSPSTNGLTTNKRIRVTFNSDSSGELPWKFKPSQKEVFVLPGETALAFFEAENFGENDVTGIATYNVAPDRVAPYFAKVECFCFESQRLLAKEQVDLPVFFFIDSDILDDPACKDVQDVVLSYTFFAARRNEKSGQLEPDTDLSKYQVGMDLPGVK